MDDMVDQAHVSVDEVIPGSGLLPKATVEKLAVEEAPTLVLVVNKKAVARLDGRTSAPKIEAMLDEHLGALV